MRATARYHVDQVRPAGEDAYELGGVTGMTPAGVTSSIGTALTPGRIDTGEGEVAGVPPEVRERFEGHDFDEDELRKLGARPVDPHWQIAVDDADDVLEVTRFER